MWSFLMGLAFVALTAASNDGTGTALNASSAINVQAGDLLAAWCKHEGTNGTFTVSTATAGHPANAFTFDAGDEINHTNNDLNGSWGYLLSASADTSATFRFISSNRAFRRFFILQFRPDSGETVSKDGSAGGQGSSNAPNSGSFATSGTDVVKLGGYGEFTSANTQNEQIDATTTGVVEPTGSPTSFTSVWYKLLSSASTGAASASLGVSADWICGGIAFKSEAGGAGGNPVVFYAALDGVNSGRYGQRLR